MARRAPPLPANTHSVAALRRDAGPSVRVGPASRGR